MVNLLKNGYECKPATLNRAKAPSLSGDLAQLKQAHDGFECIKAQPELSKTRVHIFIPNRLNSATMAVGLHIHGYTEEAKQQGIALSSHDKASNWTPLANFQGNDVSKPQIHQNYGAPLTHSGANSILIVAERPGRNDTQTKINSTSGFDTLIRTSLINAGLGTNGNVKDMPIFVSGHSAADVDLTKICTDAMAVPPKGYLARNFSSMGLIYTGYFSNSREVLPKCLDFLNAKKGGSGYINFPDIKDTQIAKDDGDTLKVANFNRALSGRFHSYGDSNRFVSDPSQKYEEMPYLTGGLLYYYNRLMPSVCAASGANSQSPPIQQHGITDN